MKKIFRAAAAAFFPKTCAACGEIIPEEAWLCEDCRNRILRCDAARRCPVCGLPKKQCVCKNRIFRFEGCIAPFVNTKEAKAAMMRYKYGDYKAIARFFAEEMAKTVKREYGEIVFDAICYVPMHRRKRFQRGTEPAKLLAETLSEFLKIPVDHGLLTCATYGKKSQHELNFEGRRENVQGLYRAVGSAEGKTILLVDDIKTSGFTLDECAKQLLNVGASEIRCVTALITYPKQKKKV